MTNSAHIASTFRRRVAVLTIGAAMITSVMVGGANPANAASSADAHGGWDCISINGQLVYQRPGTTAQCVTDLSTGNRPNIAKAKSGGFAEAYAGNNNIATADQGIAFAGWGDNNRGATTGLNSGAVATGGNNNSMTASGDSSGGFAGNGNDNQAFASGVHAGATASGGNDNQATALGANSYALASYGNGNQAKAIHGGLVHVEGNDNSAISRGSSCYITLVGNGQHRKCGV